MSPPFTFLTTMAVLSMQPDLVGLQGAEMRTGERSGAMYFSKITLDDIVDIYS